MKRLWKTVLCLLLCLGCTGVPSVSVPTEAPTAVPTETPLPIVEATPTATNAPTEAPTPSLTPEPTEEPTPTPVPTLDPNRPMVALTFDDGPNLTLTEPVLAKLKEYNVVATFFVLASAINDETGPMLQHMVDQGCEIGVHGLTHARMTEFSRRENTVRLRAAAKEISGWIEGGYTPQLMRPPGGYCSGDVIGGAGDANMAVIMWSVDTLDWKSQDPVEIMKIVKAETKDGAIILCHDHHKPTLDVLDELIPWLLEQGYDLVTVSELLNSAEEGMRFGRTYEHKPGT